MNLEDCYVIENENYDNDNPYVYNRFLTKNDINEEDSVNGLEGNVLLFSSMVLAQEFLDFLQNKTKYDGEYFWERFGNQQSDKFEEGLKIVKLARNAFTVNPDLSSVWFD